MHTNKNHILFIVGIVTKGLIGLFEFIGAALLFTTGELTKIVIFLTQHEFGEDPNNFIANHIKEFLPYFSINTQLFVAWYFLIHGITNIILVISLLRKKLWAYPLAIFIQSFFITYALYRFSHTHSKTLILITIFDIFLVWLIWREYQRIKSQDQE